MHKARRRDTLKAFPQIETWRAIEGKGAADGRAVRAIYLFCCLVPAHSMLESLPAMAVRPTGSARHIARPPSVTNRIVWRYALPIVTVHLLALAALVPWFFSWTGVVLLIGGIYVYGALGINIAYHRLLTHRSFKCPLWWEHVMVTIAICCLEDAPGSWVATHRLHHNDSDEPPDPHTPRAGFFWSHMGWLLVENQNIRTVSAYERFAHDVLRDPYYMRLQRTLIDAVDLSAPRSCLFFCRRGRLLADRGRLAGPLAVWFEPARLGRAAANGLRLAHYLVGELGGPRLRLSHLRHRRRQPQ